MKSRIYSALVIFFAAHGCASPSRLAGEYYLADDSGLTLTLKPDGTSVSCYQGCSTGTYKIIGGPGSDRVKIFNKTFASYYYQYEKNQYGAHANIPTESEKGSIEMNFETGIISTVIYFDGGADLEMIKKW